MGGSWCAAPPRADLLRGIEVPCSGGELSETGGSEVVAGVLSFLERTDDVVGICDAWGRLLYLNPAACKLLGVGSAEGLTTADIFPAESFALFFDVARTDLQQRGSWNGEIVAKAAGSRLVRLNVSATMDLGPAGENRGSTLMGRVLGPVDEPTSDVPVDGDVPLPLRVTHAVAFSAGGDDPGELARTAAPEVGTITELQVAFTRGDVLPYAQAVVDPRTRVTAGYRGFTQWHHPTKGLLGPATVAEISAGTSLAPVIDLYVARQTATLVIFAAGAALAQYTPASAGLLLDAHAEQRFDEIATAYFMAMHQFHLEIDARTLNEASPTLRAAMRSLADADLSLVLADVHDPKVDVDDLRRLGFRGLELSPRLVNDIAVSPALHYAVAELVERAHDADLLISATGIRSEQQHDTLLQLHCDLASGDLYAPAQLTEIIAD
jgi:EAL domain-containing protein (putative c-di-GMP-specific phosphodiesterase class I)